MSRKVIDIDTGQPYSERRIKMARFLTLAEYNNGTRECFLEGDLKYYGDVLKWVRDNTSLIKDCCAQNRSMEEA